jgi:hypothetical protein
MASRVQQDLTGEDINYFVERGFSRADYDLNTLLRISEDRVTVTEEQFRITGRPYGWMWYRTVFDKVNGQAILNYCGDYRTDTPIDCYVAAELARWGEG